jgi:hypothetical protein
MGQIASFFAGGMTTPPAKNASATVDQDLRMLQYIKAHRKISP